MHRFASPTARTLAAATGLALLAAVPVTAHEDHGTTAPTAKKTENVDIAFAAVAGGQPVACGVPIPGLGTTRRTAQLQDLRFYVSDVKLIAKGGRAVPVTLTPSAFRVNAHGGAVTLIDLENGTGACSDDGTARMNAHVRGTVPKGTYTGVRWTVGVPFALNHTDVPAAPAPLNSAAMAWSWQAGRKFTKIEVTDPECAGVFRALGIGWRADGLGNGASPTAKQTVFKAVRR